MNFFKLIFVTLNLLSVRADYDHETTLDHENKIQLKWSTTNRSITFKLSLNGLKLADRLTVGFGMSERGHFRDAEMVLFELDFQNETIKRSKMYLDSEGVISIESDTSSYQFISNLITTSQIEIEFERSLDTCNSKDYKIEFGTVHLIYFLSEMPPQNLDTFKGELKLSGMKQVQLVKSSYYRVNVDSHSTLEITNDNAKIPATDTTYWCKVYKLAEEFKEKHHITAFESVITNTSRGVVHHMELFHCVSDPRADMISYNGPCNSESKPDGLVQCRKVIAAWAMGADRFVYPRDVGGVIGGFKYSPYLVLEVHYDNPRLRDDIVDSSGIRIYYERTLRTYDAGILEIGLEYSPKMAIPPQMASFHLNGHCLSECTQASLTRPITLFASQLHTHLTGRRVWTSLVRNNRIVEIVNRDNHYDQMFQEIRLLPKPVEVRPGDALITQCVHETMDRHEMTVGGYSIRDEMCVNYLHYYPLVELEVCKSSISDRVLDEFFLKMKRYDLAHVDLSGKSVRENFNSIRWTPLTSSILDRLYDVAPVSFSCNSSHGKRIRRAYSGNQNGVFDLIQLDDENDQRILSQNYAPNFSDSTGYCD